MVGAKRWGTPPDHAKIHHRHSLHMQDTSAMRTSITFCYYAKIHLQMYPSMEELMDLYYNNYTLQQLHLVIHVM